ncbi:hypothetical protein BAE44_0014552 [Dichanthelium oligosanthes]|uniref:Uncharacterized protein n=1 Tax=Dichanthelium oligosanthes TaxID=888268 RepID=A0A1E5VH30_9POAL|nr:hypothetical protein BAE44_0014552 [Dichanthelium oligosanthes]
MPRPGPADEAERRVQLKCYVTQYIRAGHARGQRRVVRAYRGDGAEASFVVATRPEDVPGDDDGVRDVLRQLLREIRGTSTSPRTSGRPFCPRTSTAAAPPPSS